MQIKSVTILMVLAVIPTFCQPVTEEEKALDSFKGLVRRHVDSYKPYGHEHVWKFSGGWAKKRFTIDPDSVKFDVEKTNSLVSPLVATVTFTLTQSATAMHPTEEEAAADTVFISQLARYKRQEGAATRLLWVHRHVFAYQDHQWQPTSRQHHTVGSSLDGESFPCVEPSEPDGYGCLEEFDGGIQDKH